VRIPRIYIDVPLTVGSEISLDEAHRHIIQVLRLKVGARLVLFNGLDGEYAATLRHIERRTSTATVDAFVRIDREPSLEIELWQGIAKGARMDYVLQKAVELGVRRIRPLLTDFTAASRSNWQPRLRHWQGVIISACEQSGRTRVPELCHPQSLGECPMICTDTLGLVLDSSAEHGLRAVRQAPRRLILLVGPEGGLSAQELQHAQDKGFKRVRMGPRTLRTETASLAALSVAQALWGDLQ
jgi:16S rRNA (uracil1498-N3)-methyltransferase